MLFSTTSACNSIKELRAIFDSIEGDDVSIPHDLDHLVILDLIQNIVVQAGALSKFFWPANPNEMYKARANHLCNVFGITDDNPLRSRNLRNYFEHLDEKLDLHLRQGMWDPLESTCRHASLSIL